MTDSRAPETREPHAHTFKHMHDTAHGLEGTHMVGSERFECKCGFTVHRPDEAFPSLVFVLDHGEAKK